MEPVIDHIEITVKDLDVAVPFYDKLIPLLGFDLQSSNRALLEEHELDVVEYLEGIKFEIVCTKQEGKTDPAR